MGNGEHVSPRIFIYSPRRLSHAITGKRSGVHPNTDAEKKSVRVITCLACVRQDSHSTCLSSKLVYHTLTVSFCEQRAKGGPQEGDAKMSTLLRRHRWEPKCVFESCLADPALTHAMPKTVTMRSHLRAPRPCVSIRR
jgi:hypothetical protein